MESGVSINELVSILSDLIKRVDEHKYADAPGFTHKYGCKYLVYYELMEDMLSAGLWSAPG